MDTYTLVSMVLTIAVLMGYLNHRFIKMQSTIAIMVGAMGLSLILLALQHFHISHFASETATLISHHFRDLLLKGMLSFLLFAGALSIDISALKNNKWEVGILASLSTVASFLFIGIGAYYLLPLIGIHLSFLYCLLFGALISPTDPIAVLATFKEIGAPKRITTCVAGESLFNDGVGIVLFTTVFALAFNGAPITFSHVAFLFLKQAIGGSAYGLLLARFTFQLMKKIHDQKLMMLLTLASVSGGYSFALWLNISGPLAMVVAGIYLGNKMRQKPLEKYYPTIEMFWELIDELLNAMLFLLIGFELLSIHAMGKELLAALLAIPFVLLVRLITVAIPMRFLQFKREQGPYTITVLTWGGLRGGLAVALVLSLPESHVRQFILAITYAVVAFAVIIQGLSIKPLARLAKNRAGILNRR